MADHVTPLTTEHLRIMREDIATLRTEIHSQFTEIKQRYRVQEHQIMGLKRDEVSAAEDVTALRHQIDGLIERLHRLEQPPSH